jgi:hypothetical protein
MFMFIKNTIYNYKNIMKLDMLTINNLMSPIDVSKKISESVNWNQKIQYVNPTMTNDYNKMNVKSLIDIYEKTDLEDYMVGWTDGLNFVNQNKRYVSENGIYFEKSHKTKSRHTGGHLKCSMIIYYLCQESDFFDWYRDHDTTCYHAGF